MKFVCQCVIDGIEYPVGMGVSDKESRRDAAYHAFSAILQNHPGKDI